MGAGPSLGKFLKSMDDDDLVKLIESAYKLEPQRMEKLFVMAKMRYYEETGQEPPREVDAVNTAAALSLSAAALLPPPQAVPPASTPSMLSEMLSTTSAATTSSSSAAVGHSVTTSMDVMTDVSDDQPALAGDKDPMNALWTFEGHHLRKLQTAKKNPQRTNSNSVQQGMTDQLDKNGGGIDQQAGQTLPQRELDTDGYPVMYGSCGRDKRYGRCSVCYFRGLRCNTDHYCACCQRPVCIRPRMYPGEEHQKICWNVLHMDKEIVKRVQKKKRKLQAATSTASVTIPAATRLKNVETYNTGGDDTGHTDRPNDSLNHPVVDLHRAPSIPTVVADVSGAVDL